MNGLLQKIKSSIFSKNQPKVQRSQVLARPHHNGILQKTDQFPTGYHVFGITEGPEGKIMVGAGNPSTGLGAIFLQDTSGSWKQIELPDETAWLSQFVRLNDGSFVASGMSLIGRAAILKSNAHAQNWKSIDMDLHSFSQINSLVQLTNGELLAATGNMITQGKTKPILLRSKDGGVTWEKEEIKLPITQFHTLTLDGERIYAGTCGDHDPMLYYSDDQAKTWSELPKLPSYKTYKTIALQPIKIDGKKCLIALMWGYKLDIADRVVRLYISDSEFKSWTEQPLILDSHFIFSFFVSPNQTFYAGSEKGKVLESKDLGRSWKMIDQFPTNIGAYAIFQDQKSDLWFGKDFVEPDHHSLWKLKN